MGTTAPAIEERPLGQTSGLTVPAVGMGTWQTLDVRGAQAEREAHAIVREALDTGARFVDSSPMYGQAERVLGEGLAERRAEAVVGTKGWHSGDGRAGGGGLRGRPRSRSSRQRPGPPTTPSQSARSSARSRGTAGGSTSTRST